VASRPSAKVAKRRKYYWRISRIKGTPAADIGRVEAANADEAIDIAIKEYGITDLHQQSRLVARRVG
jgi:hypothetical protein